MPLNRTTSGDAGPQALALIPTERSRALSNQPSPPTREAAELADVRAQLAEALEEVAFLGEQLRSTEAWSAHQVETLQTRHRGARETFVRDLTMLIQGLDQHARVHDDVDEGERAPVLEAVLAGDANGMESGR